MSRSSFKLLRNPFARYALAVAVAVLTVVAARQFQLQGTPYWIPFGGVVCVALLVGFGPSLLTTGLSVILVQTWLGVAGNSLPTYKPTAFIIYSLLVIGLAFFRHRAEAQREASLRSSSSATATLAALVESSDDAIITQGLDGSITSWNRAAERLFGYTAAQAIGQPVTVIIPPELRDEERRFFDRIVHGERLNHYETRRVHRDGTSVHVSLTISPICNERGEVIGASKIARDITARKIADRKQRESDFRQQAFLDNLPAGVWFLNATGEIFYANAAAQNIWQGAKYVGLDQLDQYKAWWHGTDRQIQADEWAAARAILKGEASIGELIDIQCFDGSRKTITNSAVPVRDTDGSILGAVIINQDVSERIAYEEKIKSAERRLNIAQQATNSGAWEWTINTGELWWSEGVWQLHGYEPRSFPPSYQAFIEKLIIPEDRAAVQHAVDSALKSGIYETEYRTLRPDGRLRYIVSRGQTIFDSTGKPECMVGIAIDVTERKLSSELLRRTEQLAAAGRLAATIAHEINNPLESLTNLVFLARTDRARADSYLDLADEELSRVSQIAKQTLSFYKSTSTPEAISLPDLLKGVLDIYGRRLSSRGVEVETRYETDERVWLQTAEARQVFSNLIANAIDAMPRGGRLVLHVKKSVAGRSDGDSGVTVTVADSGSGISRDQLANVFQPFFTTKENGTGLGLWVAKGIMEKIGGTLRVRSRTEPGRSGTVFSITFPTAESAEFRASRVSAG